MIRFFESSGNIYFAVKVSVKRDTEITEKLQWLFGNADVIDRDVINGFFIGPRKEMITPWSTNAVEITQNMGIKGIERIEEFQAVDNRDSYYDPMLQALYNGLDQDIFTIAEGLFLR